MSRRHHPETAPGCQPGAARLPEEAPAGEAPAVLAVIVVGSDPAVVGEAMEARRRQGRRVGAFAGDPADAAVMEAALVMAGEYFGAGTAVQPATGAASPGGDERPRAAAGGAI